MEKMRSGIQLETCHFEGAGDRIGRGNIYSRKKCSRPGEGGAER